MFINLILDPKLTFLILVLKSIILLLRLLLWLHLTSLFLFFIHYLLNFTDDAL